jgi:hypothetical protein
MAAHPDIIDLLVDAREIIGREDFGVERTADGAVHINPNGAWVQVLSGEEAASPDYHNEFQRRVTELRNA